MGGYNLVEGRDKKYVAESPTTIRYVCLHNHDAEHSYGLFSVGFVRENDAKQVYEAIKGRIQSTSFKREGNTLLFNYNSDRKDELRLLFAELVKKDRELAKRRPDILGVAGDLNAEDFLPLSYSELVAYPSLSEHICWDIVQIHFARYKQNEEINFPHEAWKAGGLIRQITEEGYHPWSLDEMYQLASKTAKDSTRDSKEYKEKHSFCFEILEEQAFFLEKERRNPDRFLGIADEKETAAKYIAQLKSEFHHACEANMQTEANQRKALLEKLETGNSAALKAKVAATYSTEGSTPCSHPFFGSGGPKSRKNQTEPVVFGNGYEAPPPFTEEDRAKCVVS